jgi:hypothetical protein
MIAIRTVFVVALGLAGCAWDAPPLEWQAPSPIAAQVDSTVRYRAVWTPGATPEVSIALLGSAATLGQQSGALECPGSRVTASAAGGSTWSAWWRVRADSSAVLLAARRDATGAQAQQWIVDSVDTALLGCARPAPSIIADSTNGYVHVSYFMVAPEGPGVFYAHLMDSRASHFEPALAMVYGEKPVRVAIASRADTVAVVYEDPNSERGRIAMSLSTTAGHLFEQTARLIPVSTSSQQASQPQIVRLAGGQVWVGWTEDSQSGNAFLLRRARIVSR